MNLIERVLLLLQEEMERPKAYGWFHLLCIVLTISIIIYLFKIKKRRSEKQLKKVLFIYGVIALTLEILKQISWSFEYNPLGNIWDYEWYAFPFQLCTTPIYVSLICLFLRNSKVKKSLLSYMAFITILGSIMTMIIPNSCFTGEILINIHTMWLHCGSLVVSIYLIISGFVKIDIKSLKNAFIVFLIFVGIALTMNIIIFNTGILNGETFNMFYISPYFISSLPVFDFIQENVPYLIYLLTYILAIGLGSFIVFSITKFLEFRCKKM